MIDRDSTAEAGWPSGRRHENSNRRLCHARIGRVVATAALAVVLALAAAAQDTELGWTVYGPGASTCKDWTAARKKGGGADLSLRAWVSGFMSAAHYYHTLLGDTLARLPVVGGEDQTKWIDAWCGDNPNENLAVATRSMLTEIAARGRGE